MCIRDSSHCDRPKAVYLLKGGRVLGDDLSVTLGQIFPNVSKCQQPLADAAGAFGAVPGFYCRLRCVPTLEVGFTKCPLSLVHGLASCSPPSAPPGGLVVVFTASPSLPALQVICPLGRSCARCTGRLFSHWLQVPSSQEIFLRPVRFQARHTVHPTGFL